MKNSMILFFFVMIFVIGCSDNSTNITDARDGKNYGLVKIGTQIWMSKNLDASTYRNGDTIRHARTKEQWQDASRRGEGAWCYYDHDPKNGEKYGKLYNWYAVNDSRGLAPIGYHIPNIPEWTVLTDFLGGELIAGSKMKSTSGWANGGNGNNSSGFNGLPGGYCNLNGNFINITDYGHFWSSSEVSTNDAWILILGEFSTGGVSRSIQSKDDGSSVRCLRD